MQLASSSTRKAAEEAAPRLDGRQARGAVPACAAAMSVALLLSACPPLDDPYLPYPEPDYQLFGATVQPVIDQDCAWLGCHGDPARTLTLYGVGLLRAESATRGTPIDFYHLSEEELLWNYDSLRMTLVGERSADDAYLVLKTLDPAQGGIVHAGGDVVFETRDDPGFQALRDWVETGL